MLHGLILEYLAPYAPSAALTGLTQSPALQCQKSLQVVHTIGAEIAASVPFHLGFSNSSERSSLEKKKVQQLVDYLVYGPSIFLVLQVLSPRTSALGLVAGWP